MSFNILVVDDSPLARKIVAKTVRMSGLPLGDLLEAGNGREALEVLESSWVDVVFADINMPEMDGGQMIERMAANELLASIPVIVISSDRSEKRMEYLLRLGVRAYLTKPLTPEGVAEVVRKLLVEGDSK
jgi:two-component system chemotaxis response regulator CheY